MGWDDDGMRREISRFARRLPDDAATWLADETLGDYRRWLRPGRGVLTGLYRGGLFTRTVSRARRRVIQFWSQADYGPNVEDRYPIAAAVNLGRVLDRVQRRLDRTGPD